MTKHRNEGALLLFIVLVLCTIVGFILWYFLTTHGKDALVQLSLPSGCRVTNVSPFSEGDRVCIFYIDSGQHTLEITCDGPKKYEVTLDVIAGEHYVSWEPNQKKVTAHNPG